MNQEKSKNLGFRMPAEWEPHEAVWLAWPHDIIAFPKLDKVERAVVEMIRAVHGSESVELLVVDNKMEEFAKKQLMEAGVDLNKIHFRQIEYVGGWLRDNGGLWAKDNAGKLVLVNFGHNLWGNKFPDLKVDIEIPKKVAEWTGVSIVSPDIILEGGSIELNGQGVCLTTEQCLLNPNRNPGITKADIEKYLDNYLGVKKTIWLNKGLLNDHTDGHVDEIAKFVGTRTILCAYEEDEKEENYIVLKKNYEDLLEARDHEGNLFQVIKLPMPHMKYEGAAAGIEGNNAKAPASYINFYIGNTVILTSVFNDPNDQKALEIIQSCFPGRKVVPIDCSDIIYGGGAIHCMTQQQPVV